MWPRNQSPGQGRQVLATEKRQSVPGTAPAFLLRLRLPLGTTPAQGCAGEGGR